MSQSDLVLSALLKLSDRVCDERPTLRVSQYPGTTWSVSLHTTPGGQPLVTGTAETFLLAVVECRRQVLNLVRTRAHGDLDAIQETEGLTEAAVQENFPEYQAPRLTRGGESS